MAGSSVRVAVSAQVAEGKLVSTQAGGQRVLLSRIGGKVYAAVDRCPHMGMSLAKGKVDGRMVTCPWHNSRFDLCTGKNMDWVSAFMGIPLPPWTHKAIAMGKAPAPLKMLAVEEVSGEVFVTI